MRYSLIIPVWLLASCFSVAHAQMTHTFKIRDGKLVNGATPTVNAKQRSNAAPTINYRKQWMMAALASLVQHDYAEAEQYYSKVIRQYGGDSEAHLQRAVVRRELHKERGMVADAKIALSLLNQKIKQNPRRADFYHKRSMALRLLNAFDLAKKDLRMAVQLKGKSGLTYQNDLRAIELERRIAMERK